MKENRNKSSRLFKLEKGEKCNTLNFHGHLNSKSFYQVYYNNNNNSQEYKLKDSSEDIRTNFKTKTNIFNSNGNECNSISSINDSINFNYFKEEYDNKSNKLSTKNEYNNFCITDYGGVIEFEKEGIDEKNLKNDSFLEYFIDNKLKKDTEKIDYRYYSNYIDIKNIDNFFKKNKLLKNEYCWLATYDKLIKRKKLLKLLKFYRNPLDETKIIEKCIKIENFEIFYNYNFNKPLIRPGKNFILVKLYLLNFEQLNIIFNYLNRVNIKLNKKIIKNNSNRQIDKGKYYTLFQKYEYYPYSLLYYLGNYMNINIFSFSNYSYNVLNNDSNNSTNNIQLQTYPSSTKIAKFIKLLMLNFPDKNYNFDFFIFYAIANLKYNNFNKKYLEINEIVNNYNINKKESKQINDINKDIDLSNKNKDKNNNDNNKNYFIQKLKDSILTSEEKDSNCSLINSKNSKMINSTLNSIIIDDSVIIKDFINSSEINENSKNKEFEFNTNKNKTCLLSVQNKQKIQNKKFLNIKNINILNKSYNTHINSKSKDFSKYNINNTTKNKNIKNKISINDLFFKTKKDCKKELFYKNISNTNSIKKLKKSIMD